MKGKQVERVSGRGERTTVGTADSTPTCDSNCEAGTNRRTSLDNTATSACLLRLIVEFG
jgi:hypothetical protein